MLIEGVTPSGGLKGFRVGEQGFLTTEGDYVESSVGSVQTAAIGTDYTTLPSASARAIDLVNLTGTTIEYRRNGTGAAFPILANTGRIITGITNANQIGIRRADTSNTQVTVHYAILS